MHRLINLNKSLGALKGKNKIIKNIQSKQSPEILIQLSGCLDANECWILVCITFDLHKTKLKSKVSLFDY